MMTMTRRVLPGSAMALGLAGAAAAAFPERQITLVISFAAGGSTDVVGRIVAERRGRELGPQIVVQKVGGAGGSLGDQQVAQANPDGYTILMGTVSTHALNPLIMKQKPYDPVADCAPVSLLVLVPNVLAVNPERAVHPPAGTPPEAVEALAAAAKATVADPAVAERMAEFSATIVASTPAELGDHVRAEKAKWEPVVRDANVSKD